MGNKFWTCTLVLFIAIAAARQSHAQQIIINASQQPYSQYPAINQVTISNDIEVRNAALTQAIGVFRISNPNTPVRTGMQFLMIYHNDSREFGMVVNRFGSVAAVIVPGSQHPGTSGVGVGGGSPGGPGNNGGGSGPGPTPVDPPGGGGGLPCVFIPRPDGGTCILIQEVIFLN